MKHGRAWCVLGRTSQPWDEWVYVGIEQNKHERSCGWLREGTECHDPGPVWTFRQEGPKCYVSRDFRNDPMV